MIKERNNIFNALLVFLLGALLFFSTFFLSNIVFELNTHLFFKVSIQLSLYVAFIFVLDKLNRHRFHLTKYGSKYFIKFSIFYLVYIFYLFLLNYFFISNDIKYLGAMFKLDNFQKFGFDAILVAIIEEFFFRRFILTTFKNKGLPVSIVIIVGSLFFTVLHIQLSNVYALLQVFLYSVFFYLLYIFYKMILAPILIHFLNNYLFNIFSEVTDGSSSFTTDQINLIINFCLIIFILIHLKLILNQQFNICLSNHRTNDT